MSTDTQTENEYRYSHTKKAQIFSQQISTDIPTIQNTYTNKKINICRSAEIQTQRFSQNRTVRFPPKRGLDDDYKDIIMVTRARLYFLKHIYSAFL